MWAVIVNKQILIVMKTREHAREMRRAFGGEIQRCDVTLK